MVISKMNSVFVKHGRWFFGIFTVLIIVSFVLYLSPGKDYSLFSPNPNSPSHPVGKAFGQKITRGDLIYAASSMSLAMAASYGMQPNNQNLRDDALKSAFDTSAALIAAAKLGISVSDEEVAKAIMEMPAFHNEKGAFDLKRFNEYKTKTLEPAGYTAQDLDAAIRSLATLKKLQQVASSQVLVTDDEVKQFQLASSEKFNVRAARFEAKDFASEVVVSNQALQTFYQAHGNLFILAPRFSAETVRFNYEAYKKAAAAQLADTAIKDYYAKNQAEFKKGNATQTLAEATPKIKETLIDSLSKSLAIDAAKSFRNTLYDATADATGGAARIDAFRTLAKSKGYEIYETGKFDLGAAVIKNIGKEPAFSEAIASCTKNHPICKTILGSKAAFVAILIDKQDAEPGKFDEVKSKVEEFYRETNAIVIAKEKAAAAALKISEAKNISSAVDSFALGKIKFEKVEAFSQKDPPACPDAEAIMELAFPLQAGKLSKVQNIKGGALLVFVDKRTLPSAADIEKERDMATAIYKQQKQKVSVNALSSWIDANSEEYASQEGRAASK